MKRTILIGAENHMSRDYGPNKCNLDHIKTAKILGISHISTILKKILNIFPWNSANFDGWTIPVGPIITELPPPSTAF